jgi:ankyrin repeat domain-containing protein 50
VGGGKGDRLTNIASKLCETGIGRYPVWLAICYACHAFRPFSEYGRILSLEFDCPCEPPSSLYWAAITGLSAVVHQLQENGVDINTEGEYYGTALQAAAARGHERIVKLLQQEASININAQVGQLGTALQAAARNGREKIVELLLKAKADVNAQGGYYGIALQAAATNENEEIVELLLQVNADVNAQGGAHGTALQAAAANGHGKMVGAAAASKGRCQRSGWKI